MAANQKSSCTTTNLTVGDNEQKRTPVGRLSTDDPRTLSAEYGRKEAPATANGPTVSPAVASGTHTSDRANVSGMDCNPHSLPIVVKPAGFRTITGSTPGDHRAPNSGAGITDKFKNQGGPRTQMPGQRNSRNYNEDGKSFQSTVMTTGEEAGD